MPGDRLDEEQVQDRPGERLGVVVVATDPARAGQYGAALRMAQIPALVTLDADEASTALESESPSVLVLDQGLPRMVLFRLYGSVRADSAGPRVQVVFVGQEDDTGPDDHYLPGDPSPLAVAAQVSDLVADQDSAGAADEPGAGDVAARVGSATAGAGAPVGRVTSDLSGPAVDDAPQDSAAGPDDRPIGPAASAADASLGDSPPTWLGVGRPAAGVAASELPAAATSERGPGVAPDSVPASPPATGTNAAVDAPAERRPGRRLDVILFRMGLALLVVGAILFFLQGSSSLPWPLSAPTVVPSAPTRNPSASPSPAAWLDGSVRAGVRASSGR